MGKYYYYYRPLQFILNEIFYSLLLLLSVSLSSFFFFARCTVFLAFHSINRRFFLLSLSLLPSFSFFTFNCSNVLHWIIKKKEDQKFELATFFFSSIFLSSCKYNATWSDTNHGPCVYVYTTDDKSIPVLDTYYIDERLNFFFANQTIEDDWDV